MVKVMICVKLIADGTKSKVSLVTLIAVFTLFENNSAFAVEGVVTKTAAPDPVLILSNSNTEPSIGFARFSILGPDIPAEARLVPRKLLGIRWSTTYYPQTLNETVELCYYRPFSSQRECRPIQPNSSDELTFFNDQPFGHGSIVDIRHSVLGGERPYARPAGVDSVTFRYRY